MCAAPYTGHVRSYDAMCWAACVLAKDLQPSGWPLKALINARVCCKMHIYWIGSANWKHFGPKKMKCVVERENLALH